MKTRCAIYARKSTDESLEQDFNSLDAQFESCAAYIASQRHEGWKQVSERYDDGGISGGTLKRPGLEKLLNDVDAGRIDMVVVYKIDRLTRSLADFAKLVDRMELANCLFVSVTQSFNTSSSMGRLTLNMLLSFAQFEREVTSERIRDKIAASKKKGLWMGGLAPLGYDPHPDKLRRELVVNDQEKETVQRLFGLYLQNGCLSATECAADAEGLRSKVRTFSSGRVQGGSKFSRGQIYTTLTNPVYRGLIRHKDQTFQGTHPAIIDEGLWDAVQSKLQDRSVKRRGIDKTDGLPTSAPLLGKFRDENGERLTPTYTKKGDRRICYYVSNGLVCGKPRADAWRLPAVKFEKAVAQCISDHLADFADRRAILVRSEASVLEAASQEVLRFIQKSKNSGVSVVFQFIDRGCIERGKISIVLSSEALADLLCVEPTRLNPELLQIDTTFSCRKRGQELKIVAGETVAEPDKVLVNALRNANRWARALKSGNPIQKIAADHHCSPSYVRRIMPLATLSPKLQEAILDGTLPESITLETFVRSNIPLAWADQESRFQISGSGTRQSNSTFPE